MDAPFGGLARCAFAALLIVSSRASAGEAESWSVHTQATFVLQANSHFRSPYQGPNSLDHRSQARETFDLTLYAGFRPWKGAELWVNPEIDQGFGLSNTLGVSAFPSGEAYKVGKANPYPKLPRWFLRQTVDLGGESEKVDADLNQLAGHQSADRLVLTLGKFSVVDLFDTSERAHDPRSDFLNWAVIDAGTFDYAANAWGYTYGAAAEIYEGAWAYRGGFFALSDIPNSENLDSSFEQNELVGEIEHRHAILRHAGKLKITFFRNRGRMGRFEDAIRLAKLTGQLPDIAAVRRMQSRAGVSFNIEQEISRTASLFVKGGVAGGQVEPYEFTDGDRSITTGLSLNGSGWHRADDTFGLAGVISSITNGHSRFLDLGGLGILVGDGRLPHPGPEEIIEAYYAIGIAKPLHLTFDYQFVRHPAFNRDRGPVSVGAVRAHVQF